MPDTPEMIEKEIWVYLLAYNLIRILMAQAAMHASCLPNTLSFKHSIQLWLGMRCTAYPATIQRQDRAILSHRARTVADPPGQ